VVKTDKFGTHVAERFVAVQNHAAQWQPRWVDGLPIVNAWFTPAVSYQPDQVAAWFVQLQQHGTFGFSSHPVTGLVQTSDTSQCHMQRQWVTDSCMVGYWQRQADPTGWQRSMLTSALTVLHPQAVQALTLAEADPNWYRTPCHPERGMFHLYVPQHLQWNAEGWVALASVTPDPTWQNNKRLESQAQLLWWLVNTLQASVQGLPWGWPLALLGHAQFSRVWQAVAYLTRYLLAVTTPPTTGQPCFATPSSSSWEEAPFAEGMTSDAGFMVLALQAVQTLTQQAVFAAPLAQWLPPAAVARLAAHIVAGQYFVAQRITHPLQQGHSPSQTPLRPMDMSLYLLAASGYVFDEADPIADCAVRLGLLNACNAALLGPYGTRRFNTYTLDRLTLHDNYLNVFGNFPCEWYADRLPPSQTQEDSAPLMDDYPVAGEDANDAATLFARQVTSRVEYSAQWGLGLSASLQALAAMRDQLQPHANRPEAGKLLTQVNKLWVTTLNRCLALLPDAGCPLRADGTPCPPYAAMEAYQVVLTADAMGNRPVWLPGAHTLPWHAAQLFDALSG
jgi:hypothetical protein